MAVGGVTARTGRGRQDSVRPAAAEMTAAVTVVRCLRTRLFYNINIWFLLITRSSSGDEIANVNFLYDDIVHILQNKIDLWINSATDRRGGYALERMFTKFSEITQCNGHYVVQGHSRSPILVPIESSYTTSY